MTTFPPIRFAGPVLAIATVALSGSALAQTQARLVGCGHMSCLRISGHRSDPMTAIQLSGRDLAVAGGKAWHVTLPLATARENANASRDTLAITSVNAGTGTKLIEIVAVPPGSLGRRIELASLVVRAH